MKLDRDIKHCDRKIEEYRKRRGVLEDKRIKLKKLIVFGSRHDALKAFCILYDLYYRYREKEGVVTFRTTGMTNEVFRKFKRSFKPTLIRENPGKTCMGGWYPHFYHVFTFKRKEQQR